MKSTTIFVKRLGRHHFAHLRCVAEGIDIMASALRYLGIEHGHQAITAHRQVISAVRAVTRRHVKDSHWRLIGLAIPVPSQTDRPSGFPFARVASRSRGYRSGVSCRESSPPQ